LHKHVLIYFGTREQEGNPATGHQNLTARQASAERRGMRRCRWTWQAAGAAMALLPSASGSSRPTTPGSSSSTWYPPDPTPRGTSSTPPPTSTSPTRSRTPSPPHPPQPPHPPPHYCTTQPTQPHYHPTYSRDPHLPMQHSQSRRHRSFVLQQ